MHHEHSWDSIHTLAAKNARQGVLLFQQSLFKRSEIPKNISTEFVQRSEILKKL